MYRDLDSYDSVAVWNPYAVSIWMENADIKTVHLLAPVKYAFHDPLGKRS